MTAEPGMSPSPSGLNRQPIPCQSPGCSRNATKASDFTWCYWCDPSVPEETKKAAQQLGGRRGLMASTEAVLLLDAEMLKTPAGRTEIRARLMAARAAGKLGGGMFRDLLAGLDSAARDQERQGKPAPPPVLVEVQRFGPPNGHEEGS
jgi:hypothetical protein